MKYVYKNKKGVILAEAEAPIKFNLDLFPIFKEIAPVFEDTTAGNSKKKTFIKEDSE